MYYVESHKLCSACGKPASYRKPIVDYRTKYFDPHDYRHLDSCQVTFITDEAGLYAASSYSMALETKLLMDYQVEQRGQNKLDTFGDRYGNPRPLKDAAPTLADLLAPAIVTLDLMLRPLGYEVDREDDSNDNN